MNKIFKIIKILTNAKFQLLPSLNSKIIIYDNNNAFYLFPYLKNLNYQILHTRYEKFYILVIIYTIFKSGFKNIYYNYKKNFINFIKPNLIITFTDNDLDFLQYKFSGIKKIAIQNAIRRDCFPDIFSILKYEKKNKYNLDHIFCFGDSIGRKYKKYLNCEYTSIGSFRNNLVKINTKTSKTKIAFISQFRHPKSNKLKNYFFHYSSFISFLKKTNFKKNLFRNIYRADFYKHDQFIFKNIANFANDNNIDLTVIGESKYFPNKEHKFFKSFTKKKFTFLKRTAHNSSYKNINKFKYIVGVDSTMLYESLARGKKVGFFSGRISSFKNTNGNFGWPLKISPRGAFWTNKLSKMEVYRILNNLIKKPNIIRENKKISESIILFDYKNKKFKDFLLKITKKNL